MGITSHTEVPEGLCIMYDKTGKVLYTGTIAKSKSIDGAIVVLNPADHQKFKEFVARDTNQ
jgi:hypothetical protein